MTAPRSGYLFGFAAYALWGSFPLYFPLLEPGGPVEIVAHRIFWSLVAMVAVVLLLRRVTRLRAVLADRRTVLMLALAAVTISVNWCVFIYGVNSGRVVETSLGYFINPLVSVAMGVVIFGERMRRAQWVAIALAVAACLILTWDYGRVPYIALALAFSFGTYGLAKKRANAGAIESLTVETALVGPVALGYLVWLGSTGAGAFGTTGASHALLLASTGIVTAVPLLCFGAAATRIPLSAIGLLQYLTPTMHFGIGVFVYGEEMPASRLAGFALVWLALAIFTTDAVRRHRAPQQPEADPEPI